MPGPIPAPFADLEALHSALLAATPADRRAHRALAALVAACSRWRGIVAQVASEAALKAAAEEARKAAAARRLADAREAAKAAQATAAEVARGRPSYSGRGPRA